MSDEHQIPQWYRWPPSKEQTAQDALAFINSNDKLPLQGKNAKTGEDVPGAMTTIWYPEVVACTDGWYGFPQVDERVRSKLGISEEVAQYFIDTFEPVIEDYDPAWIPTET